MYVRPVGVHKIRLGHKDIDIVAFAQHNNLVVFIELLRWIGLI